MATTKMTKREMFISIMSLDGVTDEIRTFCEHEIELLDRKKSNGSSKPTKTQTENITLCNEIRVDLATLDAPVTVSEFMKLFPKYDYTLNKLSAMFKKLVDNGDVEKIVEKRKSLFKIVNR